MSNIGHNRGKQNINAMNENDRKKLKLAVLEINDSMTRIASEREAQKDIIDTISSELDLDKKMVRRMAKVYFNANFASEMEEQKVFEQFYNAVIRGENV